MTKPNYKGSRYKLDDLWPVYELCHAITFTTPRHKMKIDFFLCFTIKKFKGGIKKQEDNIA